ncbi:hypothetical protein HYW54_02345 [Candidatus Gottesmanbacteria bacterium]|nr:hypothetical protein [Candidatus Gottesmanbacteria bacterium]
MVKIIFLFLFLLIFPISIKAQAPQNLPILSIASPKQDSIIFGTSATLSFVVGNFKFDAGRVLLWLDESNPENANGEILTSQSNIALTSLPEGKHTILLEVVKKDNTSYKPKITKKVDFFVKHPPPTQFPSPTPSSLLENLKQNIRLEAVLFIIGGILVILGFVVFMLSQLDKNPRV